MLERKNVFQRALLALFTVPAVCRAAAPTVTVELLEPKLTPTADFAQNDYHINLHNDDFGKFRVGDMVQIVPTVETSTDCASAAGTFPYQKYRVTEVDEATGAGKLHIGTLCTSGATTGWGLMEGSTTPIQCQNSVKIPGAGTAANCKYRRVVRPGATSNAATLTYQIAQSEASSGASQQALQAISCAQNDDKIAAILNDGTHGYVVPVDCDFTATGCACVSSGATSNLATWCNTNPNFVAAATWDTTSVAQYTCTTTDDTDSSLAMQVKAGAFGDAANQPNVVGAALTYTADRTDPTVTISATDSTGATFAYAGGDIAAQNAAALVSAGAAHRSTAKIPVAADLFSVTELGPVIEMGSTSPSVTAQNIAQATGGATITILSSSSTAGLVVGDVVVILSTQGQTCDAEGTYTVASVPTDDTFTVEEPTAATDQSSAIKCEIYKSLNRGADQVTLTSVPGSTDCLSAGTYTVTSKDGASALNIAEPIVATSGAATKCVVSQQSAKSSGEASGVHTTFKFTLSEPAAAETTGVCETTGACSTPTLAPGFTAADVNTLRGAGTNMATEVTTNMADGTEAPYFSVASGANGATINSFAVGDTIVSYDNGGNGCGTIGSFVIQLITDQDATNAKIYVRPLPTASTTDFAHCALKVDTCPEKEFSGSDTEYFLKCNGDKRGDAATYSIAVAASAFKDDALNTNSASVPPSFLLSTDTVRPTVEIRAYGAPHGITQDFADGANTGAITIASVVDFRVGDQVTFQRKIDSDTAKTCNFDTTLQSPIYMGYTLYTITAVDTGANTFTVGTAINVVDAASDATDCTVRRYLPSGSSYNNIISWEFFPSETPSAAKGSNAPAQPTGKEFLLLHDSRFGYPGTTWAASTDSDNCAASEPTIIVNDVAAHHSPGAAAKAGAYPGSVSFVCDIAVNNDDKDVIVSVPANSWTDSAGNYNQATGYYLVRKDLTKPIPLLSATEANGFTTVADSGATASDAVIFKITIDDGAAYTTGSSSLPAVYGSCQNGLNTAYATGCGNIETGTLLKAGDLTINNCNDASTGDANVNNFLGSKGEFYLRCRFKDGTSPDIAIAADKFTDNARNLNVISVDSGASNDVQSATFT